MALDLSVSQAAKRVLLALRDRHNVLITGAPGCGKTRLLEEVRRAFTLKAGLSYAPGKPVPFPKDAGDIANWLPSPECEDRKTWSIDFHQGTRYRDFVRGLEPTIGQQAGHFRVRNGVCWLANQHALRKGAAALVVIDEINRGPAVQVFGDLIVAMESDKRLRPDGTPGPMTHTFPVIDDKGDLAEIALSGHLYILAAMNQADTSVEPLDVAFLRRFSPFSLQPDPQVIVDALGLGGYGNAPLPATPVRPDDVYAAAFRAWSRINSRISIGRGKAYCLGHGVLLQGTGDPRAAKTVTDAAAFVATGFATIRAHVEEVFFGDLRAVAETWNIGPHNKFHPWRMEDRMFAGEPRIELQAAMPETPEAIYALMRAIAEPEPPQ